MYHCNNQVLASESLCSTWNHAGAKATGSRIGREQNYFHACGAVRESYVLHRGETRMPDGYSAETGKAQSRAAPPKHFGPVAAAF